MPSHAIKVICTSAFTSALFVLKVLWNQELELAGEPPAKENIEPANEDTAKENIEPANEGTTRECK